jgi:nucleotide-binding universal stress UspA family protein
VIASSKRILWSTDFSPLSFKAAEYARAYREIFGAELHAVHVCQLPVYPAIEIAVPFEVQAATLQSEMVEAANAHLEKLSREVFPGETIQRQVLVGNPWDEICEYARRQGIDLIVVATHGRTGLKHILLGSVAEKIVQHASCPVLVVKSFERDRAD